MYLDHYGLKQSPFKITPNTEFFYTGGNRGAILDALLYAVTHGEGIIKVTGEIGSGKTMLCRMLESKLPDNIEAIYLANPSLNRDEVFHAIADELGIATEGKRGGEIMRLMQHCLIQKHATSKQVVLLVEEAQAMPLDTLEEIRLLSNLETAHHKLLQIVLFGQPELDDNLNLPHMRQLKERITHGFNVPPLDQKDIPEYLTFRLRAAGYHGPDLFSPGAIKLITTASQGITRRINVLADKALLAAFSENTHQILPKHIKAAIEDSEFAPSPGKLSWKKIGLVAALLGLGIALGAGWQPLNHSPAQPPAVAPVAQIAPEPVPQPAPQESVASVTEPAPAPKVESVQQQNSPAQPPADTVSAPSSAQTLTQQRLVATQAWLEKESEAHYTVQLMLLTDSGTKVQLVNTLNKLNGEIGLDQVYVYPTRITADHQYGITLGNFSSRDAALAALAKLPASYQSNRPTLRTVKGIRTEIAKHQTQ